LSAGNKGFQRVEELSNQSMAAWGKCLKPQAELGGQFDGCQEFEPFEDNPKMCETCNCARGFHEKLISGVAAHVEAACVAAAPSAVGATANPSASSAGTIKLVSEVKGGKEADPQADFCELLEKPPKKAKLDSEKGESSQPQEATGSSKKSEESCPPVTRNSMASLQKSHPANEYRVYELKVNESSGNWEIWCQPC
jgi:hypothetical protein